MNWTRQQLKSNAKLMVKKNWFNCGLVAFIMSLLGGGVGSGSRFNINYNGEGFNAQEQGADAIASGLGGQWAHYVIQFLPFIAGAAVLVIVLAIAIDVFFGNPLRVGGNRFFLHNIHSQGTLDDLTFAFKNQYMNVVKAMLITDIIITLWSLLLIIPGIYKSYQYRMVPYLLADNPELTAREAMDLSRVMMDGDKMNAFVLDLSFIPWQLLSAITIGIVGIIWVNPYVEATNAELYTALSQKEQARYY